MRWKERPLFPAYLHHSGAIPGGSRGPPPLSCSLERTTPIPSLPAPIWGHSRRVSGSNSPNMQPGMDGAYSQLTCITLQPFQEGFGIHLPQPTAWKGGSLFPAYLPHSAAIPGGSGSLGPPPQSCSPEWRASIPSLPAPLWSHSRRVSGSTSPILQPVVIHHLYQRK